MATIALRRGSTVAVPVLTPPLKTAFNNTCAMSIAHLALLQKEVELWFEWFVQRTGLPSSCCTCVGLTQQGGNVALPAIEAVTDVVPLQDGLEVLRKSFDKLVMRVLKNRQ